MALMQEPTASGEYLSDLSDLAYLAVDEADRMVEASHIEEMRSILVRLPRYENPTPSKKERAAAEAAAKESEAEKERKRIESNLVFI